MLAGFITAAQSIMSVFLNSGFGSVLAKPCGDKVCAWIGRCVQFL